jgi:hypothetical protein
MIRLHLETATVRLISSSVNVVMVGKSALLRTMSTG